MPKALSEIKSIMSEDCALPLEEHTSLVVSPSRVIQFDQAVSGESVQYVELRNESDVGMTFKIRTTHPKKYKAKPSHGNLDSKASIRVKIAMNSRDMPYSVGEQKKERFLIQSVPVSSEVDDSDQHTFWDRLAKQHKPKIGSPAYDEVLLKVFITDPETVSFEDDSSKPVSEISFPASTRTMQDMSPEKPLPFTVQEEIKEVPEPVASRPVDVPDKEKEGSESSEREGYTSIPQEVYDDMLRKLKDYQEMVDYTVKLTVERDSLAHRVSDLIAENESLGQIASRCEVNNTAAQKVNDVLHGNTIRRHFNSSSAAQTLREHLKGDDAKQSMYEASLQSLRQEGVSVWYILIVALIAYLAGKL